MYGEHELTIVRATRKPEHTNEYAHMYEYSLLHKG